jgi:hypothetical protein
VLLVTARILLDSLLITYFYMFKQKIAAFVAVVATAAMPFVSSATVTIQDGGMTINGNQTSHVRAGSTFNLMFLVDVNGGDEVEFGRVSVYDLYGNLMQAPECKEVVSRLVGVTNGQANIRGVKTASDLPDGEYRLVVETFGVAGPSSSNRCDDNNQNDDHDWTGRLFIDHTSSVSNADVVIGGSSSTGTGAGSADEMPSWLEALVARILGNLNPAKPAVCTGLSAKVNAATPRATTYANGQLQTHLINNGYASVITYGATGFYGDQTTRAVSQALVACQ